MIKRGKDYTISGDNVTIATDDEYWEYQYDLLDRLIKVKENGITVAEYAYNHRGLRVKKEDFKSTIYYTFNLDDQVIYEQENGEYSEYIYVRGQHFARRDGNLLSLESTSYFYHTDHLGSTVMVTDITAEIVWSSEYTPFGLLAKQEGDYDFQKAEKFTGKDLDQDTGLYYYNARWYYAEIGRFISADSYKGELENPQTLNLYIYTTNNPLIYVDPSGNVPELPSSGIELGLELGNSLLQWLSGLSMEEEKPLTGIYVDEYVLSENLNSFINLTSDQELEDYYGIEYMYVGEGDLIMRSPTYNVTKRHLVGDSEGTAAFIMPVGKTYETRLNVRIIDEKDNDFLNIYASDYLKIPKYSNMLVFRSINIYAQDSFAGYQMLERLLTSYNVGAAKDGFENAFLESPLEYKVSRDVNISRIELEHNILFTDALIYGYRSNRINLYVPEIMK